MTQPPADVRAVTEYRIPAPTLLPGDLVNTAPGGEDDWQQVLSHTAETPGDDADAAALIAEIGDRYVLVRLTDGPGRQSGVLRRAATDEIMQVCPI
jgi:hypothetical protein